jgi:TolB protein
MSRIHHGLQPGRIARFGVVLTAVLTAGTVFAAVPSPAGAAESAATTSSTTRPPLFFSRLATNGFQIYLEDQTGKVTALTTTETNDRNPSPNRGGTRVAFDATPKQLHALSRIDVMDGNGAERHTVVADPQANLREPSLSPDGTKIVFTRQAGTDEQVYLVNADGSGLRQLSTDGGKSRQPAWSPDGQWIAFAHEVGSIEEIYKMDGNGAHVTRVTYDEYGVADPAWSPDGTRIAYSFGDPFGTKDPEIVWTYASGQSSRQYVTHHAGADTQPTWSPDGKTIVYTSVVNNTEELVASNVSGTDSYLVTAAGQADADASYGYPNMVKKPLGQSEPQRSARA